MKVMVKFFGQVKDYFPSPQMEAVIEKESLTVAELKAWLIEKSLQPEKSTVLLLESALATESRILQKEELISSEGLVFVLPPVCGG